MKVRTVPDIQGFYVCTSIILSLCNDEDLHKGGFLLNVMVVLNKGLFPAIDNDLLYSLFYLLPINKYPRNSPSLK